VKPVWVTIKIRQHDAALARELVAQLNECGSRTLPVVAQEALRRRTDGLGINPTIGTVVAAGLVMLSEKMPNPRASWPPDERRLRQARRKSATRRR